MKVEDLDTGQFIAVVNNSFGLKVGTVGKVYGYSNSTKNVTIEVKTKSGIVKHSGNPKYLIGVL